MEMQQQYQFFGDMRAIINRTNRDLVARVNNIEYPLKPGRNVVPAFVVPYAVKQNPRPGSMLPTGQVESLVAVEGISAEEDVTMLSPDQVQRGGDLMNRDVKPLVGEHVKVSVPGRSSIEGATAPAVLDKVTVGEFD
jgi:hypothetical protein